MQPIATDVTAAWSVRKSGSSIMPAHPATTKYGATQHRPLVHPAKAIGWNKMPSGRDTRVVPSNVH